MDFIEKTYSSILTFCLNILNPFKKIFISTECKIHKLINLQAVKILMNDNYINAFIFYGKNTSYINAGTHWADQDFKSSFHLYNPYTEKGLYGRKNAMDLAVEYYNKATNLWLEHKKNKSMFYLGAALHIIQDMTIPQHAKVRLLDNHRQYEQFIKKTYFHISKFRVEKGTYNFNSIYEYIKFNSKCALNIYKETKSIKEKELRYYTIAESTLPLAQRTTAGCMLMFYNDVVKRINSLP